VKNISIKDLGFLYKKIYKESKEIIYLKINSIFNYLNLSVHLSIDEREFDIINYKLLLSLSMDYLKKKI
tara:strand:+ start:575 stop:781 length:207 start_codon:yes stop_codon:yes gene_type:complete